MRWFWKVLVLLLMLTGIGLAARGPLLSYWRQRNAPKYRLAKVEHGSIRATRTTTGRVEPKLRVQIGAFVSGPIVELLADFNDEVAEGDILARIDPAIYQASFQRDQASLNAAQADVERVTALLQQAKNDERRGIELNAENDDYVSAAEMDQLRFSRQSLEAQLKLALASVQQAEASLSNSRANLDYTLIRAPVDGMVIDRKIDPGQTLAAQFQTPELFVLGVEMREQMYIYASVDEADIGEIRKAQAAQQPVRFRVDAYRDELFTGTIKEIRLSSTEMQNVVTYPVVVTAPNAELKLLPGMTASLTFQIEQHDDILRVPRTALRFFPRPEQVREQDRPLLEGGQERTETDENVANSAESPTVESMVAARSERKRHVWVQDAGSTLLRAIEVELGISDYEYAELLSGDLTAGQQLVVGVEAK